MTEVLLIILFMFYIWSLIPSNNIDCGPICKNCGKTEFYHEWTYVMPLGACMAKTKDSWATWEPSTGLIPKNQK